MNPVITTEASLIPNSSGCLREFSIDRFDRVKISIQIEFANAGTVKVVAAVAVEIAADSPPETSLPLLILAAIASFNVRFGYGDGGGVSGG